MSKQKEIGLFFKPREKHQEQQPLQHKEKEKENHHQVAEIQSTSAEEIVEISLNYQPHQPPKTFKFPETIYGKQKRSFQHHWFEEYPWLDYDVDKDSVTCIFCKRQNSRSNLCLEKCKEETFLKKRFQELGESHRTFSQSSKL